MYQKRDRAIADKLLVYIAEHEGEPFDHAHAAAQLGLTPKALFKHLHA